MGRVSLNKEQIRPICIKCNTNKTKTNGKSKNGFQKYSKYCSGCHRSKYNTLSNNRRMGYQLLKKDKCEKCKFIPEHSCQLDVDHIDGDRNNNAISNLQTLCANCHRLKTHNDKHK